MNSQQSLFRVALLACSLVIASFTGSATGNNPPPPPPPPPPPTTWDIEILSMDLSAGEMLSMDLSSGDTIWYIGSSGEDGVRRCRNCQLIVSNIGSSGDDGATTTVDDEIMVLLRPAPGIVVHGIGSSGMDGVRSADSSSPGERIMQPEYGGGTQMPEDEIMVLLRPAPGADSGSGCVLTNGWRQTSEVTSYFGI